MALQVISRELSLFSDSLFCSIVLACTVSRGPESDLFRASWVSHLWSLPSLRVRSEYSVCVLRVTVLRKFVKTSLLDTTS